MGFHHPNSVSLNTSTQALPPFCPTFGTCLWHTVLSLLLPPVFTPNSKAQLKTALHKCAKSSVPALLCFCWFGMCNGNYTNIFFTRSTTFCRDESCVKKWNGNMWGKWKTLSSHDSDDEGIIDPSWYYICKHKTIWNCMRCRCHGIVYLQSVHGLH